MSRAYELHQNGDCNDFCPVCQWEDAQEGTEEETDDE